MVWFQVMFIYQISVIVIHHLHLFYPQNSTFPSKSLNNIFLLGGCLRRCKLETHMLIVSEEFFSSIGCIKKVFLLFILKKCDVLNAAVIVVIIISIPKLISSIFLHAILHWWPTFQDFGDHWAALLSIFYCLVSIWWFRNNEYSILNFNMIMIFLMSSYLMMLFLTTSSSR